LWLFIFYIAGLYDKHTVLLKRLLFSRILHTQFANILIAALLFIILPFSIAPKTNLIIYLFVSVILITVWRLKLYNYLSPKTTHKAILIADGEEAIELVDEVNNNERYNYSFVRMIENSTALSSSEFEAKLLALINKENISMIVANPKGEQIERILPTLFDLAFLKFKFTFVDFHKVYEDTFDRVPLSALHYNWFINHISQSQSFGYDVIKRGIDIVCAILLLIPCTVLFAFIALAIKIGDKGPLLYKTERLGQYNTPFTLYKFRTKNGTDVGEEALNSVLVDTKVGSFLRKTRLDELPQLFNVLKGSLSFIGPRPEMPALTAVYAEKIPYYNTRHLIKPGLSGWAQIKNNDAPRGGVDVERTSVKLSYDLFYLKNRSLLLDLQIALQTLSTLVRRTGS
jgi:lipopolysaccharide/colanic/teichoic acid biosynthesis glycosyltransferase